jgi:hypothetical protein
MSLGRQVLFNTPPLRSLNCRPQSRQRNRTQYPSGVIALVVLWLR